MKAVMCLSRLPLSRTIVLAEVAEHKIKEAGDELNVSLIKNPDIVATIAQQDKRPFMVGFAAETRNVEEYAAGKLVAKKARYDCL